MSALTRRAAVVGLALAGVGAVLAWRRGAAQAQNAASMFDTPLSVPDGPLKVFHLGHSLVGRDMPAMLAQLAGHEYASQLGWGTSLKEHWEPELPINGFDVENDHPRYRDAKIGITSGDYSAVVLTEMVEIADAIRYHDSATYLTKWAKISGNARVYVYETWHHTDDPKGWLTRLDLDLPRFWQGKITTPAMMGLNAPIYLIPAGQVMAAFVRKIEQGEVPGISAIHDLFSTAADGTPDTIHLNDIGAYLVALTHYAVLYHRTPVGLPHQLNRADGTPADAPSAQAALVMQQVVWDVVQAHPETGVAS